MVDAAEHLEKVLGFKSCFGGEELRRANAVLAGARVGGTIKAELFNTNITPSTAQLSTLSRSGPTKDGQPGLDVHTRELRHACEQYSSLYPMEASSRGSTFNAQQLEGQGHRQQGNLPDPADVWSPPTGQPPPGMSQQAYHDGLYSLGLVLQELASRAAQGSHEQAALLAEACEKYGASLIAKPHSPSALYNWGVALSDLARCLKDQDSARARACLVLASHKYAEALHCQQGNLQALNNWGLVLQELSADAHGRDERNELLQLALQKFRSAVRLQPDFDRGVYNLGTVCYSHACALQAELAAQFKGIPPSHLSSEAVRLRQARELEIRAVFAAAAQYICLAFALQHHKDIFRKSLSVVRPLLPLPFLRAGYLLAPLPTSSYGTCEEAWRKGWFVLDADSLRTASPLESSLSTASAGMTVSGRSSPPGRLPEADGLVLPLANISAVRRAEDPSLPEGSAFWVLLRGCTQGVYLVAEDEGTADAWVDMLIMSHHVVSSRGRWALADALTPPQPPAGGHKRTSGKSLQAQAAATEGTPVLVAGDARLAEGDVHQLH